MSACAPPQLVSMKPRYARRAPSRSSNAAPASSAPGELSGAHLARGEVLPGEERPPGRKHELVLSPVAAEERFGDVAAQEDERPLGAGSRRPQGERGDDEEASESIHGRLLCIGKRASLRRSPGRAAARRDGAAAARASRTRRRRIPAW